MVTAPKLTLTSGSDGLAALDAVLDSLLTLGAKAKLIHLATCDETGHVHANTCYFAHRSVQKIIILTPPSSLHGKNLSTRPRCAAAVALEPVTLGDPIYGMQLVCDAQQLAGEDAQDAYEAYSSKFPSFRDMADSSTYVLDHFKSRFFALDVINGKLIDEVRFGREQYLEFSIAG
ncbi:uncharacterized protein YhbP (UPF0306 family) [Bradyrhizobium japonicum]